ncbi:MAG: XRE family transcriptional regulator [Clostridiales bacterium]|jgi:transcriptional regulator with XRE-family HTH domain|nr:XRE family transcriptional regulator [Clostridiales bacterium]
MSAVNQEIGARIKGIRELSDLSISELAKKVNTTAEKLSAYESGETDIPVSILHDISTELNIGMTELLTGEEAKLSTFSVVRRDKGVGVDRRVAYDYKALAYNFSQRKMDPYLITIEPKPDDAPFSLNTHGGQEFHYCLEGSFGIQIEKHEIIIEAGDAIYFNSACPHGMKALNGKPARELVIIV